MQTTWTPWGAVQQSEEISGGVSFVSTAGHGGLALSAERWTSLPGAIQETMMNPGYAEEDCEAAIVLTALGLAGGHTRRSAILTARQFSRYRPALKVLEATRSPEGCWICGGSESYPEFATLAPGRWLCRKCFEKRSDTDFLRLCRLAMDDAREEAGLGPSP